MSVLSHDDFVARAVAAFPELVEDIDASVGMPTLQAAALAHRLQRAKGDADWDSYERGITLVADLWDQADAQLRRELRWSFLKALTFDGVRGPVAWAYLTPAMRHTWTQNQKHLEELSAPPRRTTRRPP